MVTGFVQLSIALGAVAVVIGEGLELAHQLHASKHRKPNRFVQCGHWIYRAKMLFQLTFNIYDVITVCPV